MISHTPLDQEFPYYKVYFKLYPMISHTPLDQEFPYYKVYFKPTLLLPFNNVAFTISIL